MPECEKGTCQYVRVVHTLFIRRMEKVIGSQAFDDHAVVHRQYQRGADGGRDERHVLSPQ